jgi:hypothetical protein
MNYFGPNLIILIMENRKIKQKWFCMFGKVQYKARWNQVYSRRFIAGISKLEDI